MAFSHADAPLSDHQLLLRALQYAATFDFPVWLRPQDPALARGGVAHDGQVATRLGLPAIPVTAETVALSTILLLTRETGARVHICRLSSAEGVNMVRAAKQQGLRITCDVAIHHAHLSEMDIGYFDPNCNLTPPLRSQRDRDALRAALADGGIDALCSDHTPVDDDAKQLPFGEAETGATGVELLLPLALKWAEESKLPLLKGLSRITADPARILLEPLVPEHVQHGEARGAGHRSKVGHGVSHHQHVGRRPDAVECVVHLGGGLDRDDANSRWRDFYSQCDFTSPRAKFNRIVKHVAKYAGNK